MCEKVPIVPKSAIKGKKDRKVPKSAKSRKNCDNPRQSQQNCPFVLPAK